MTRRTETRNPGKVTKIIHVPEVKEEQAEVEIDGAHLSGRIRIVNFLRGRQGQAVRLHEGDHVDVIVRSDDVEPR